MISLKGLELVLFFTRGTSLRIWDQVGMFEREVALYRQLQAHGIQVKFVTYGDAGDLQFADCLPQIKILCNRWRLPQRWYIRLISWFYPVLWQGNTVFKSNQTLGADIALQVARRSGKKFIARSGYPHADFVERLYGPDSPEMEQARILERKVFTAADRVVVATAAMRRIVLQCYQVQAGRVTVIPNYVDMNLFYPYSNGDRSPRRICFIGRLEDQKNLLALMEAIKDLDVELVIVGSGSLGEQLRQKANTNKLSVRFMGNVPHPQLPGILNSATLFVLPSHFEGHPKTLIEAMACGLPVIGADSPGIRELICHGETGWLCGTDVGSIRAAIQELLTRTQLRAELGQNARVFAVEHFALERVVEMELAVLEELIG